MPRRVRIVGKRVRRARGAQQLAGPRLRGRGDFWSDFKRGFRSVTSPVLDVAQAAADVWSPKAGRFMGKARPIIGFGAYNSVGSKSLMASPVPTVSSAPDNGVRVRFHEYIRDVSSTTNLANLVLNINPGIQTSFPWLSNLARSFQKWDPQAVIYTFKSTSATALGSTSTALGTIIGAVIYDVNGNVPTSKAGILGLSGARAGVPSQDNLYPVECAPSSRLMRNLLVRSAGTDEDLQKYDLGKLLISTIGSQTVSVAGELHVSYDIILKSPILGGAIGNDLNQSHYHLAGVTTAAPLGTVTTHVNELDLSLSSPASGQIKIDFPTGSTGTFIVNFRNTSDSTVSTPTLTYAGVNNSLANLFNGHTVSSMLSPTTGATNASYSGCVAITITDPSLTSSLLVSSIVSTGTSWTDLAIHVVNASY